MGSQNLKSKINEVLRCNYFFKITSLVVSEIFVFSQKLARPYLREYISFTIEIH